MNWDSLIGFVQEPTDIPYLYSPQTPEHQSLVEEVTSSPKWEPCMVTDERGFMCLRVYGHDVHVAGNAYGLLSVWFDNPDPQEFLQVSYLPVVYPREGPFYQSVRQLAENALGRGEELCLTRSIHNNVCLRNKFHTSHHISLGTWAITEIWP